jgi:hypothetical protein
MRIDFQSSRAQISQVSISQCFLPLDVEVQDGSAASIPE